MHKFCRGIISPLSLIVIGFLVASVYGGVKIAKDKNITLNLGSKAAPNYVPCKVCKKEKCVNNVVKDSKGKKIACKSNLNKCDKDSECQLITKKGENEGCDDSYAWTKCGKGLECVGGKCKKTAGTPAPTPTPYCSRTCLGNHYCEPDINGGTCKIDIARSTTTPKPTSSPTPFSQYWNCEKDPNALGCKSPTPTPKGTPSVKCGGEPEPGQTICTKGALKTCDQSGRLSSYTCPSGQCQDTKSCKPETIPARPVYPDLSDPSRSTSSPTPVILPKSTPQKTAVTDECKAGCSSDYKNVISCQQNETGTTKSTLKCKHGCNSTTNSCNKCTPDKSECKFYVRIVGGKFNEWVVGYRMRNCNDKGIWVWDTTTSCK